MKTKQKLLTFLTVAAMTSLTLPTHAQAGRIVDKTYPHNKLFLSDICQNIDDCKNKGVFLNPDENYGIQANYHNETELVDLITKLYVSSHQISKERNSGDSIVYFISQKPKKYKEENRPYTFFDTIGLFSSINLDSKERAYSTINEVIESNQFNKGIEKYGKSNMYIQAINIEDKTNQGFYNHKKELVVDKFNNKMVR